MNTIKFSIEVSPNRVSDEAYVTSEVEKDVVDAVLRTIGTDVKITIGDVTSTLAMWLDPDHWSEDWAEATGGAGFEDFIAGLG